MNAFNQCIKLNNLVFPASLTTIQATAFGRCSDLTTLTFQGQNPPATVDALAFSSGATAAPITTINLAHSSPHINLWCDRFETVLDNAGVKARNGYTTSSCEIFDG